MTRQNLGNDVFKAWADQTQEFGRNYSRGTIFFENETIYSYGHHFPMAYRKSDGSYIVNADTYSSTTSQHQGGVRAAIRGRQQIQIPFSILRGPGISVSEIEIVHTEPDRQVLTGKQREVFTCTDYQHLHTKGECYTLEDSYMHLLGRSVLRVHRQDVGFAYFLSGTDETMVDAWCSYFLAQLPRAVDSVADAIEALKPQEVLEAEAQGIQVKRQGEWFFIPVDGPLRGASDVLGVDNGQQGLPVKYLRHRNAERQRRHLCTHLKMKQGVRYAKGTVRHTGGEHKMLKLGNVWHRVYENEEVRSYRGAGRVD